MAKKTVKKRSKGGSESSYAVPHNESQGQSSTVQHVSEAPCSVELSRDAKGQARWSIKLYGDRDDMGTALDELLALDARLREETHGHG